jgi:hypothetical protein
MAVAARSMMMALMRAGLAVGGVGEAAVAASMSMFHDADIGLDISKCKTYLDISVP